jgi:hypothetical protein
MTATTIDTLDFARKLRDGGVDERTANTIAQEVGHFVADNLAAPAEVAQIKGENADVKSRLTGVENRLTRIETDVGEVKNRLTRVETNQRWQQWTLGFIIAVQIGMLWNLFTISEKLAALTALIAQIPK